MHGFARTLAATDVGEPAGRYLGIMGEATEQLAELIDELALVARIEAGRYDPVLDEVDLAELARAAAERLGSESASVAGAGATVRVDREAIERALAAFGLAALRHGGVERVEFRVAERELALGPVTEAAASIVLGEELRDLGAAVARRLVEAHGGSVAVEGETLRLSLPA